MSKTILIITDNLPDQINGVVTTYKNIEAHAICDGYHVVVLHPGWFSYFDCPGYNEVKITYPRKVGEKIEEINPDHIHIASIGTSSIGRPAIAMNTRTGKMAAKSRAKSHLPSGTSGSIRSIAA